MSRLLGKKSKSKEPIEEQWFAVWDIVFPGLPRPSSAYIQDGLTEGESQLQEIIVNRWPSILACIPDDAEESVVSTERERLIRGQLIRATLIRLQDDFLAEQARNRTVRSASSGHRSPEDQKTSSNRSDSAIEVGSHQSNHHLSASSSGEAASQSIPGPTIQLETGPPARSQSSVVHNRRERPILPAGQNSLIANYGQQQTSMPPPVNPLRSTIPDLPNLHMTDDYVVDTWFGADFVNNDPFQLLTEDKACQSLMGSTEPSAYVSRGSMEPHADDWSMPEN